MSERASTQRIGHSPNSHTVSTTNTQTSQNSPRKLSKPQSPPSASITIRHRSESRSEKLRNPAGRSDDGQSPDYTTGSRPASRASSMTLAGPYAGSARSGGSLYFRSSDVEMEKRLREKTGWTPVMVSKALAESVRRDVGNGQVVVVNTPPDSRSGRVVTTSAIGYRGRASSRPPSGSRSRSQPPTTPSVTNRDNGSRSKPVRSESVERSTRGRPSVVLVTKSKSPSVSSSANHRRTYPAPMGSCPGTGNGVADGASKAIPDSTRSVTTQPVPPVVSESYAYRQESGSRRTRSSSRVKSESETHRRHLDRRRNTSAAPTLRRTSQQVSNGGGDQSTRSDRPIGKIPPDSPSVKRSERSGSRVGRERRACSDPPIPSTHSSASQTKVYARRGSTCSDHKEPVTMQRTHSSVHSRSSIRRIADAVVRTVKGPSVAGSGKSDRAYTPVPSQVITPPPVPLSIRKNYETEQTPCKTVTAKTPTLNSAPDTDKTKRIRAHLSPTSDSERTLVNEWSQSCESYTSRALSGCSNDAFSMFKLMEGEENPFTGKPFSEEYKKILKERRALPVFGYARDFLNMYLNQPITLVKAAPGSGKTTQLPQFIAYASLLRSWDRESFNEYIVCTQPRRIAARSAAERVAKEMDLELGQEVGYRIRFDNATEDRTFLTFTTDAQLLRMNNGNLFDKFTVIIVDEVHERSIAIDVLLGLLKSAAMRRKDLKVVIMSATIDEDKFRRYFASCDVSRKKTLYPLISIPGKLYDVEVVYADREGEDPVKAATVKVVEIHKNEEPGDVLVFLTGVDEIEETCRRIRIEASFLPGSLTCIPLYGSLTSTEQDRIHEKVTVTSSTGAPSRKVIVSTNIAEVSVTIKGIAYVVDSGRVKKKTYDPQTCISTLASVWISKASAEQRKGRAGRTGKGKCFRLYTENEFLEMEDQSKPEILESCLEEMALQLISFGENVTLFDYIDRPSKSALQNAIRTLRILGAIDSTNQLTDLGRKMYMIPLEPRLTKVLLASVEFRCSQEVLRIVSMLCTKPVFLRPHNSKQEADIAKKKLEHHMGDHITLLGVFGIYLEIRNQGTLDSTKAWCKEHFLSSTALEEAFCVHEQILDIMVSLPIPLISADVNHLEATEYSSVRQALTCGLFMQVARSINLSNGYKVLASGKIAFLHPSSVLVKRRECYIICHEVMTTSRTYIITATPIDPHWFHQSVEDDRGSISGSVRCILQRLRRAVSV